MRNPAQNLDSIAATHLNLVAVRCPISRVVLIAADSPDVPLQDTANVA